jgi:NAD(P)-dependent dehydrogenase (short-subunit alcohol dehydrogenase family)
VRDLKAMRGAVDRAAGDLGGLDIAVANAGIVVWTSFEDALDSPRTTTGWWT